MRGSGAGRKPVATTASGAGIATGCFLSWLLFAACLLATAAQAQSIADYLGKVPPGRLLPGADSYGPLSNSPPMAPILKDGAVAGYAILTTDYVNAVGYSGKPIRILLGLDPEGTITGAELVEHHEPIVLVGIPEAKIRAVIAHFIGRNMVRERVEGVADKGPDIVAGATVTIMVIDDSIRRAALKFARAKGIAGMESEDATPRRGVLKAEAEPAVKDWQTLVDEGAVRLLELSVGEVSEAFRRAGESEAAERPEASDPDARFIRLGLALVTVPTIGRSLLGARDYARLKARLKPGQQAVLVMGSGLFSFKGSGYVRGGIFDRIQIIQGDVSVRFHDRDHLRIARIPAAGAPDFREVGLFFIPDNTDFDPTVPFRLELLVNRQTGPRKKAFVRFALDYALPAIYVERRGRLAGITAPAAPTALSEEAAREALWLNIWRQSLPEIARLAVLLGVLTLVFFFQDWFVRRPRLAAWVRYGYLSVVLVWLGFFMNAQLSVVNVLTFANALVTDFSWGYFLMAPLIFILWVGVAAGMLFWGRGVFCGWLCPYGALQEITNRLGRRFLKIRQIELPWGLNERLWPIKYIIFLGLFGTSFYSMSLAERLAEVEPFKTAIILNFMRAWPFVVFAGGLIVVNLFIERFFCRYLCPLGAALAIPSRLRMFEWLKRYRECGNPCQLCAKACPTAAIHPDGHINVNECIYCLDCQLLYYDDRQCPRAIQNRLRRERRLLRASDSTLTPKQRAEKAALLAKKGAAVRRPGPPEPLERKGEHHVETS
ncbi:MAG: regulatory protein NosR [Alphaproteobacteria bacterium]|nr:MAG: regulatory protein NosR [Alphaproteobacteria bacterium]